MSYRQEIDDLVVLAPVLLRDHAPLAALRHWCERFAAFGDVKHGVADTLQAALSEQRSGRNLANLGVVATHVSEWEGVRLERRKPAKLQAGFSKEATSWLLNGPRHVPAVNDAPARELQSSEPPAQRSPAPGGFAHGHAASEARREERLQLRRLEISSFAEATTLLLLVFVAVPLKHLAGYASATRIMGPVHGLAFLAFAWLAVQTVAGGGWRRAEVIRLLLGAMVPFGGYLNLPWLARRAASLR